jgi:hypothetical protein
MGPYRISKVVGEGAYKLFDSEGHEHGSVVNVQQLKRAVYQTERDDDLAEFLPDSP